jgi:hypothetical protein
MALYWQAGTFREIDPDLVNAWQAANNPKATGLIVVPTPPIHDAATQTCTFDGSSWVITAKSFEQIEAEAAQWRAAMSCTPRQARLALAGAGLLTAVEAFVAANDAATQIEWEYASEIKRDWPPVMAFAAANEISDEQLDALFALAASL